MPVQSWFLFLVFNGFLLSTGSFLLFLVVNSFYSFCQDQVWELLPLGCLQVHGCLAGLPAGVRGGHHLLLQEWGGETCVRSTTFIVHHNF